MRPKNVSRVVILAAVPVLALAFQAAPAGIVKSVRADFPFVQKDSPLQILGMRSSIYDLAEQVHVANISGKRIVRLQLGWTIGARGQNPAPASFLGMPMDLNLAPGEWTTLGRQGITLTDVYRTLNHFQAPQGEVVIGAVFVQFEDGSTWSYGLPGKNRFEKTDDPGIQERLAPIIEQLRERVGAGSSRQQACSGWSRLLGWARSILNPPAVLAAAPPLGM
jgi:hypothetical protein